MAFTETQIKLIHSDIQAAMKAIAEKHNVTVAPSRVTWTAADFSYKVVFGDKSSSSSANPEYARNLIRNGFMYGLDASMIGKSITIGTKNLVLDGMRGRKAALKDADGKGWLYDPSVVAQLMAKK